MKIVVSASGATQDSKVASRFGRASHFLVFDTVSARWASLDNVEEMAADHASGIRAAKAACRQGAAVVITGDIGPKAISVLLAGGVRAFRGEGRSASEALYAFRSGSLTELVECGGSRQDELVQLRF